MSHALSNSLGLGLMVALVCLAIFWKIAPGKNIRSKVDHYLRLNGRLIAGLTCPLRPSDEFFQLRQSRFVFLGLGFVFMFWVVDVESKGLSDFEINTKKMGIEDGSGFNSAPSGHRDALLVGELNQGSLSQMQNGLNLRSSTMSIKIQTKGEGSELHFFEDIWVSKRPFEWEK